jgi:hypothetical protein
MAIAKRDAYEREFVQIIKRKEPRIYGQRGTHSDGLDVLLFIGTPANPHWTYSIRCEIKTTIATVRYFNGKLMDQYNNYLEVLHKLDVITYYCFRTLSKKKTIEKKNRKGEVLKSIEFRDGHPEDKWRVFKVDEVPQNNRETPYLDFFDENGKTIDEFIRLFKILLLEIKDFKDLE